MDKLYKQINNIFKIYNNISDKKISHDDFVVILPKLLLILKDFSLDIIDIIQVIDVLIEFNEYNALNKINKDTINLVKKITMNSFFSIERTLYLSVFLKHFLLPFNLNKCKMEYEKTFHISTFENMIELIEAFLNDEDLKLLKVYNYELSEIILQYKENKQLYNQVIHNEIILKTMILHFYSVFYFNIDEYDYNYAFLDMIVKNSINNYQQFVNYCYNEKLCDNFAKIVLDTNEINKEYEVSQKMLNYAFNTLQEEKKKRM